MNCEFCNKTFSSKSNLTAHQTTAKFCLEIQGKHIEEKQFKCEYCDKLLTQRSSLEDHYNICKEKLKKCHLEKDKEYSNTIKKIELELSKMKKTDEKNKKLLEEKESCYLSERKEKEYLMVQLKDKEASFTKDSDLLKEKIKEKDAYHDAMIKEKNEYIAKLEAKLEKLESAVTAIAMESKTSTKPITTNNTTNNITVTNNNVLNLSKEHVNKVLKDHLDYDVVYAGQAGFAKFVVDKMLKGPDGKLTYKCVDPSRQMFEFTDESGETVRDMRAEKLIQSLLDGDALKIGLDAAAKGWNTDDRQLNNARTETFGPRVNEYSELNRHNTVFRNKVSSLTT